MNQDLCFKNPNEIIALDAIIFLIAFAENCYSGAILCRACCQRSRAARARFAS